MRCDYPYRSDHASACDSPPSDVIDDIEILLWKVVVGLDSELGRKLQ